MEWQPPASPLRRRGEGAKCSASVEENWDGGGRGGALQTFHRAEMLCCMGCFVLVLFLVWSGLVWCALFFFDQYLGTLSRASGLLTDVTVPPSLSREEGLGGTGGGGQKFAPAVSCLPLLIVLVLAGGVLFCLKKFSSTADIEGTPQRTCQLNTRQTVIVYDSVSKYAK